jgi:hypothetical protein
MPKINLARYNLRPFGDDDPQSDDPQEDVTDLGPWVVNVWGPREGHIMPRVVVQSDDFTFDAALEISGDFACHEQKMKYAQFIADQLNSRR